MGCCATKEVDDDERNAPLLLNTAEAPRRGGSQPLAVDRIPKQVSSFLQVTQATYTY